MHTINEQGAYVVLWDWFFLWHHFYSTSHTVVIASKRTMFLYTVTMSHHPKKRTILIIVALVFVCLCVFLVKNEKSAAPSISTPDTSQSSKTDQDTQDKPAPFDKTKHSTSNPASIWVVVNKQRSLPSTYSPAGLRTPNIPLRSSGGEMLVRSDAASALEAMSRAAKADSVSLLLASGYRSYALQQGVYGNFANRYSAKPGHSEHQTGLALDVGTTDRVCELKTCFGATKAGKWIASNAADYGFIIRYQKGKEALVGYQYEPWHLRFVGKGLAKQITQSGQTMEQFFGLPAAPDYL